MSRKLTSRSTRERMTPNKGAMDTKFGVEIDPDEVTGVDGKALDEAFGKYETFHKKKVLRAVELKPDLPRDLICVGDCLSVMYRTDKWNEDGDDIDYKHVHDPIENKEYPPGKGVRLYENARIATSAIKRLVKNRGVAPGDGLAVHRSGPPVDYPGAIALLGKCLGFFVRRYDDGEIYECNPRNSYLFGSPKGDLLVVYALDPKPHGSILCVMAGGKLRILKEGIDG
jgi:hypothetical protein